MSRLLTAVALSSLCACSFGPKLIRPDIEAVKKVSIIGFRGDVAIPDPNRERPGGIIGTVGSAKALSDLNSSQFADRRKAQAKQIHDALAQSLTSKLGWQLMPVDASPTLKDRARQKPTGMMINGVQHLNELMLDPEVRFLQPEQRQRILSELGVDAVMTVNIRYNEGRRDGFAIGGLGSFKIFPRATVTVQMWNATQKDPVWEDSFAMGPLSALSVTENVGILDEAGETEALVDAATRAVTTLIERYQAAPTKS